MQADNIDTWRLRIQVETSQKNPWGKKKFSKLHRMSKIVNTLQPILAGPKKWTIPFHRLILVCKPIWLALLWTKLQKCMLRLSYTLLSCNSHSLELNGVTCAVLGEPTPLSFCCAHTFKPSKLSRNWVSSLSSVKTWFKIKTMNCQDLKTKIHL